MNGAAVLFYKRPIAGHDYMIGQVIPTVGPPRLVTVIRYRDHDYGSGWALLQDENGRQFQREVIYGPLGVF